MSRLPIDHPTGRQTSWTPVIVFVAVVMSLATTAGFLIVETGVDGLGGLLFVSSPLLATLIVRSLGREGWTDAGLRPRFRGNSGWYLLALVASPAMTAVLLLLGIAIGQTTFTDSMANTVPLLLGGFAVQLLPRLLLAAMESFAWQGYLEPKLASLGIEPLRRHITVGIIWALWHFPLILATRDGMYEDIALARLLPGFSMAIILGAIVYGQMRQRSRSVWPAVLMHGVANAALFPIVENELFTYDRSWLVEPRPESLISLALAAGFSWVIWNRYIRPANANDQS